LFYGCYTGILSLLLSGSLSGGPSSPGLFGGISSSESPFGDGKNILSFFGASGYGSIVYGSGYTFSSSGISLSSSSSSIS